MAITISSSHLAKRRGVSKSADLTTLCAYVTTGIANTIGTGSVASAAAGTGAAASVAIGASIITIAVAVARGHVLGTAACILCH